MLEIGSSVYIIWVFIALAFLIFGAIALKDAKKSFQYKLLFGMTIFAWIIHFSRYYLDPDLKIHTLFFEDLCGFNTMLYPFLFKMKNRVSKDIMFFVAMVFASMSLLYPNNINGDPIFYFNTIRFFFAHFILVAVPLWMVVWKLHVPSAKSIPWAIIYVIIGGMYSFSMSTIFYETGMLDYHKNYMGLWGNTGGVWKLFEYVAPFLRYNTIVDGEVVSKPIPFIYMIPGFLLFYVPLWEIMSLPFKTSKHILKTDTIKK
jgi:hypothetical protein